jgi:riboflavin synthase
MDSEEIIALFCPSNEDRTRPFYWIIGLVAGAGLVLGSIVNVAAISFVIMGLIAVCISVFAYKVEVTRHQEEEEQAQSVTTLANCRAQAIEALKTELGVPPETNG